MIMAHGQGAARYDELIVIAVVVIVLLLAVLQLRWRARHQRDED